MNIRESIFNLNLPASEATECDIAKALNSKRKCYRHWFNSSELNPLVTAATAFLAVVTSPKELVLVASVPKLEIDTYLRATSVVKILEPIDIALAFSFRLFSEMGEQGLVLDPESYKYKTIGGHPWDRAILNHYQVKEKIFERLQHIEHFLQITLPYRVSRFNYSGPISSLQAKIDGDRVGVDIKA